MSSILNANPFAFNQWRQGTSIGQTTLTLPKNPFEELDDEIQPVQQEIKLLNISPDKAGSNAPANIQRRLELMTNAFLNRENKSINIQSRPQTVQVQGPKRMSNRNFLEELHKVTYNKETNKPLQPLRESRTGHGQAPIDFNLYEALVEDKVKQVTDHAIMKSQNEMQQQMNQKTKQLKEFLDTQMKRSQLTMTSIQEELRYHDNRLNTSQRNDSKERDYRAVNSSFQHLTNQQHDLHSKHIVQSSNDDFKTKALKKNLMDDVKMAMLANRLQCKPIEGHDIPFADIQRAIQGERSGLQSVNKAQLLDVQNIESMSGNEITNGEQILQMLMPGQLKKNTMEFLDVEDIRDIKTASTAPKTQAQLDRNTYEQVLESDRLEQFVTDEQRQKTLKCLMKVLDYQLEGIKDQAKDIDHHYKQADKDLQEFEEMINRKENKTIMDDLRYKMKVTNDAARQYQDIDASRDEGNEMMEVADLIVENKLLIDQVDALLGKPLTSSAQIQNKLRAEQEEEDLMSESYIDKLYYKVTKQDNPVKMQNTKQLVPVSFGKVIVKKHGQLQKRKEPTITIYEPKQKMPLADNLIKIKEDRKNEIRAQIEKSMSPTKQQRSKSRGQKNDDKFNKQLNTQIYSAMNNMSKIMKVAFDE